MFSIEGKCLGIICCVISGWPYQCHCNQGAKIGFSWINSIPNRNNDTETPKERIHNTIVTNLTFWVLIAIVCGESSVGHFQPETGQEMKIVGDSLSTIKILYHNHFPNHRFFVNAGIGDLKKVGHSIWSGARKERTKTPTTSLSRY
jgi:hypothetical protein